MKNKLLADIVQWFTPSKNVESLFNLAANKEAVVADPCITNQHEIGWNLGLIRGFYQMEIDEFNKHARLEHQNWNIAAKDKMWRKTNRKVTYFNEISLFRCKFKWGKNSISSFGSSFLAWWGKILT